MIRFVEGEYLYYENGSIVVKTSGGLGLRINVPDMSPLLMSREGDILNVYTYMHVKEDGMALYGFPDQDSLKLFEQLITVNGVGPKAGLAIMSVDTASKIRSYIVGKDAGAIARAQGVGKKTAERVILELSDKIDALPLMGADDIEVPAGAVFSDEKQNAVVALTTLGYSKREAETALSNVPEDDLSIEEYIKKALKYLI
jgi:Holliday junction DNA helicase RuvA